METVSTNEDTGKGAMWELEKSLDQPMDAEAGRLRNMYTEKTYPTVLMLQLAFQSLGVVFGYLGTSPLYVFYNIFPNEIEDTEQIIGALSLIIYYPPEYRPINVFLNFYSEPEYKLKVERDNFFREPTVDGGVIRFKIKDAGEYPPVSSNKSVFSMVNSAFNGKRKMLRKSLQHLYSSVEIEAALTNISLSPTIILAGSDRLVFFSSPTAFTAT
ncbi:Ribosomal RNA small subunit methyltransferase A [Hordeum vulgare]|nr:Ribosomal RNA small subunit methyltransferase A [Hordeum vulgare]